MKKFFSAKDPFFFTLIGCPGIFLILTIYFYKENHDPRYFQFAILLGAISLFWLLQFVFFQRRRLSLFTEDLCQSLDDMMNGSALPKQIPDEETISARLHHRLDRLYEIMNKNRLRVDLERQELQSLVSDISHQVKTPVSNIKMLTDTLLTKSVSPEEHIEFLQGIQSQVEKLDFLFGAMVKSSRLETGMIVLKREECRIYDTLAQALSGIIYSTEQKNISVTADCAEQLLLCHDQKWTSEALFNILDNAVKYTPDYGQITINVEEWEMYVKISVTDTGRGIPEDKQASIFRRFYREEDVHDTAGVGIGLFLTREIITKQGGYIKLTSASGMGSTFSVFLPKR